MIVKRDRIWRLEQRKLLDKWLKSTNLPSHEAQLNFFQKQFTNADTSIISSQAQFFYYILATAIARDYIHNVEDNRFIRFVHETLSAHRLVAQVDVATLTRSAKGRAPRPAMKAHYLKIISSDAIPATSAYARAIAILPS